MQHATAHASFSFKSCTLFFLLLFSKNKNSSARKDKFSVTALPTQSLLKSPAHQTAKHSTHSWSPALCSSSAVTPFAFLSLWHHSKCAPVKYACAWSSHFPNSIFSSVADSNSRGGLWAPLGHNPRDSLPTVYSRSTMPLGTSCADKGTALPQEGQPWKQVCPGTWSNAGRQREEHESAPISQSCLRKIALLQSY